MRGCIDLVALSRLTSLAASRVDRVAEVALAASEDDRAAASSLAATECGRPAGERYLVLAGIDVAVDRAEADLAFDERRAVVCQGRPRFTDPRAERLAGERGDAHGWLQLCQTRPREVFAFVGGSYAVVLVDLDARSVQLGCDRFSIETLCYTLERGTLRFATRADKVFAEGTPAIDLQSLYDYLFFHVIPAPRTIFQGVSRLAAGCLAEVSAAGVQVRPHWTPRFYERRANSFEQLKEEFRDLVRAAVRREAGPGKVGAFLSGGTDSSTVTGMLGEVTGRPARTYSIGFEAEGYDEIEYARITARHFGTEHHEYYITPEDLVESIPRVAEHYDQPFGNSSALPAYYCSRMAKADGVDKLLAGDGGDELFGGNTRYVTQRIFAAYAHMPEGIRRRVMEPVLLEQGWPRRVPVVRKLSRYVEQARLPMPDRMHTYNVLEWLGAGQVLESSLTEAVDLDAPRRQQRETYARVDSSLLNAMLAYDWKFTLADNDLPKVCGTARLAGIRVGFPLLDDALVDFSLGLSDRDKVRGLKLRYFFKQALKGFLPEATIRKEKHGFGLPYGLWITRHRRLKDLASASLNDLAKRGIVRPSFVDDLIGPRMTEHARFYGEMIWVLMMLEQWLSGRVPSFRMRSA